MKTSMSETRGSSCRMATNEDLRVLLKIEQSAFPKERWATEASLQLRLELPDSATWIASYDSIESGFSNGFPIGDRSTQEDLDPDDSILYERHSKIWLLRNLAVTPSMQGRNLGKLLIEHQIESARAYGAKVIRFTTTDKLARGAELLGFTRIQPSRLFHGVPQGVWQKQLL